MKYANKLTDEELRELCSDFSKGCVFNEYEEIKDILDSVQEIRKCD